MQNEMKKKGKKKKRRKPTSSHNKCSILKVSWQLCLSLCCVAALKWFRFETPLLVPQVGPSLWGPPPQEEVLLALLVAAALPQAGGHHLEPASDQHQVV